MTTPRQSVGCEYVPAPALYASLDRLRRQAMSSEEAAEMADTVIDLLAACEAMLATLDDIACGRAHLVDLADPTKITLAAVAKARGAREMG